MWSPQGQGMHIAGKIFLGLGAVMFVIGGILSLIHISEPTRPY